MRRGEEGRIRVRELSGADALACLGPRYDALASVLRLPVTGRRLWLQAWIDTYRAWEPWLLAAEVGDDLVGVLPLARRRRAGVLDVVLLGHGPTDDARLPVGSPEATAALARAAVAGLPRRSPWRLRLVQTPEDDPLVAALAGLLPHRRVTPGQGMPLVEIESRDPDKYISRNTRKALAKIGNRLRAQDLEPQLRWTAKVGEITTELPELIRVHRERDLALGRRPDHDDPAAAAFYREVITRHAAVGEVELLTLHLDGDLAAYVCAFRDGRTLRSWDNRLAPRWSDLSAGRLANTEAVVHAVQDEDLDALDWGRGEEPYKLQSATRVVPTTDLVAWSSELVRRADEGRVEVTDRARGVLRRFRPLDRAFRRARRLWHRADPDGLRGGSSGPGVVD